MSRHPKVTNNNFAIPNNEEEEEGDYNYFKMLWNEPHKPKNAQSCGSKRGSSCGSRRRKRKKCKVDDGSMMSKTNDDDDDDDDGPIENMEFVKDHKDEIDMSNVGDGLHSKAGDRIASKRNNFDPAIQHPNGYEVDALFQHISTAEVNNLIGWANSHGCESGHDSSTKLAPGNGEKLRKQEQRLGSLLHIPKAPPPPSDVHYLHQLISERLSTNSFGSSNQPLSNEAGAKANNETENDTIPTLDRMDASAYVAIGMAVEEVFTSALMPLAEAHVERCRRLERQKDKERGTKSDVTTTETRTPRKGLNSADPFDSWTLPPSKALVQLARDEDAGKYGDVLKTLVDRHAKLMNVPAKLD